MSFDLNQAEPPMTGGLIPDGTFARVAMSIRAGGVDGDDEVDRGLLKRSNAPGSDVLSVDCEFSILEGPHARRKFWHSFVAFGGKLDENGISMGVKITARTLRGIIDSAHGLDPADTSEAAKAKRVLRGYVDLSGISFVAKIMIEPSNNPNYGDKNKLEYAVAPTEPEWRQVMNGETVPARPSGRRRLATPSVADRPDWNAPDVATVRGAAPALDQNARMRMSESDHTPTPGPAWLKG